MSMSPASRARTVITPRTTAFSSETMSSRSFPKKSLITPRVWPFSTVSPFLIAGYQRPLTGGLHADEALEKHGLFDLNR